MKLRDKGRPFHPTVAEYTLCSSTEGTFPSVDNMINHKTSLSKFKKTKIVTQLRFSCSLLKNSILRDKCWVKEKIVLLRKLAIFRRR